MVEWSSRLAWRIPIRHCPTLRRDDCIEPGEEIPEPFTKLFSGGHEQVANRSLGLIYEEPQESLVA